MMNVKRTVFLGLSTIVLIGLTACKTTEDGPDKTPEGSISETKDYPIKTIADGYLTGNGQEGIDEGGMVINSQADWDALFTKMNSVNDAIDEQNIDFSKVTVLAYFDQIQGSGGYFVDIVSVAKDGEKLVANVRKAAPTEDAIEIMTQPYMIGFIEKTNMPVVFVD